MELDFQAIADDGAGDGPGQAWAKAFRRFWPAYRKWWVRDGLENRPTYLECRRELRRHMPELVPIYEALCELAGGGDVASRFLSFWRPPAYLTACSQAVWPGPTPLLVRNYDYSAHAFDATVLQTDWLGRKVVGVSDGMWGLVDGVNDAGLAVSLTFGGRREVGEGFGVPLLIRYVLQTCTTAEEAAKTLARIPVHMSYNVTALDAKRRFTTVYLAPDRPAVVTHAAVATNHQERVEWSSHARFTATVERERFLLQRLTLHVEPAERFIGAFLKPPLYSLAYDAGFGTLYTAVYYPAEQRMELRWPGAIWRFDLVNKAGGVKRIDYPETVR